MIMLNSDWCFKKIPLNTVSATDDYFDKYLNSHVQLSQQPSMHTKIKLYLFD